MPENNGLPEFDTAGGDRCQDLRLCLAVHGGIGSEPADVYGGAEVSERHRRMSRFSDAVEAVRATGMLSHKLFAKSPIVWWSMRNFIRDVRGAGIHQETGDGIIAFGNRNSGAICEAEEALVVRLSCHADNLSDRHRDGVAGAVAAEQVEFNKAHFHISSFSQSKTVRGGHKMHKDLVVAA